MESVNVTRCCSLRLSGDLREQDHAFFVRLLLKSSVVKPCDIQQIDLKGRRGFCKVTLSTRDALERLLSKAIIVNGNQLNFVVGDGSVVLLNVFGVDEDLPLSAIVKSLQQFGSVVGEPRRESMTVDDCTFHTGTVHVQFVPKVAVPSTLYVGDAADMSQRQRLRAWHVGQIQTCFVCGDPEHKSKECPNKSTYAAAVRRVEDPRVDVEASQSEPRQKLPLTAPVTVQNSQQLKTNALLRTPHDPSGPRHCQEKALSKSHPALKMKTTVSL